MDRIASKLAELKDQQQVCNALAVGKETLYALRARGLPFLRIGKRVYYHEPEVLEWLLHHCRTAEKVEQC